MRLILLRHAEPDWPDGWVDQDVGLSDRGRGQAHAAGRELARRFAAAAPSAVLSSPLRRAHETAAAVAGQLGLPVSQDEALAGLADPALRRQLAENRVDDAFLAYLTSIQERAWSSVQRLIEASDPEATVVVASHEMTIAAIICRALSMPVADFRRLRVDIASLSIVNFQPRRTLLALLNDTNHLKEIGPPPV